MFVTKADIEQRRSQMPRTVAYPATIHVEFDNADAEAQGDPNLIEVNIENKGGAILFFLYRKPFDADQAAQARELVSELQALDAATNAAKE